MQRSTKSSNTQPGRACQWLVPSILLSLILALGEPFSGGLVQATPPPVIDQKTLDWASRTYGVEGKRRLLQWQRFLAARGTDELVFVEEVNAFFNSFVFVSDARHWGQDDYWATPTEFIASGGGDCEDFAVAKYFSLIKLGVANEKLSLNYVFATRLNQSHLVLAYYPVPGMEPWVLDNIIDTIKPASKRADLVPIYSFNASTLWKNKEMGKGQRIGHSRRIRPWRELLNRMQHN
ncbi:transglutaminase-like cysteine peptidase [Desulfobulbus rhabdoformis]|nr:transglutaminase-like cysteine peptidase [Desulfobulbus rhabdoformis]